MRKNIYHIALECKNFSDKNVKCYRLFVDNRLQSFVVGANKVYENLLQSLCDFISGKYPYIASKLKEHTHNYGNNPVFHQGAIDELVNYIIYKERPANSNRKFFISHSTEDEVIIKGFVEKILMLGCGFKRKEIFCTLDHTAIRTGDDFRNVIIENMKNCDYILCLISANYRKSEVCQNEMGAAWCMEEKRVLPFKFPNVEFGETGFLNVVKQVADITDKSKLDELYEDLCSRYEMPPDWKNFNEQKDAFVKMVEEQLI
jgi:hypothetical protein